MFVVGKKLNPNAASIGWFCAWLKENFPERFIFLDNRNEAIIKMPKLDVITKKTDGYESGRFVESFMYNAWINYNRLMAYSVELHQIGYETFLQIIHDQRKEMMSVVTVEDRKLIIMKY